MRRFIASCPAGHSAAPSAPSGPRIASTIVSQAVCAASAVAPTPAGPNCPAPHPSATPSPQFTAWGSGPWRLTSRLAKFAAAAERGERSVGRHNIIGGCGGSSSSAAGGGDVQELQPKPQTKYRRLRLADAGSPPSKSRRWHNVPYPAPSPPFGGLEPAPPAPPTALQPLSQPGQQNSPASLVSSVDGDVANGQEVHGNEASATVPPSTASLGHPPPPPPQRKRQQQQPPGRRVGQQPQKLSQRQQPVGRQRQQQRGRPSGDAPLGHATFVGGGNSRRRDAYSKKHDGDDAEDEDDDGELLGLTEEELEAMVFASARAGGEAAGMAGGPSAELAPAAGGMPSAAEAVVTAAGLPGEVEILVLDAVHSGSVSSDGAILAGQLQQLREAAEAAAAEAAAAAVAADDNICSGGRGAAAVTAADTIRAALTAVADLLGCSTEAAAAVLVNYPRYMSISLSGGGSGGKGLQLLRSFAGMLNLGLAEARVIVRRNPALLLAPYEPLRQKLTVLSNVTGLSMAQATRMVTPYMFSDL